MLQCLKISHGGRSLVVIIPLYWALDTASIWFSRPELLFLPSSSSVVLTRLSGPRSRPTTQ
jgi:hypothetical protein